MSAQQLNADVIDFALVKSGHLTAMGTPTLKASLEKIGTVEKPTHEVFGLDTPFKGALATVRVPAKAGVLPFVPKIKPTYIHDPKDIRLMLMAIMRKRPLMISGPKGTGKTEAVEQFYAALGLPCITIPCGPGIDTDYLFGRPDLDGDKIGWVDGQALLARRCGFALLLDEMDAMPSEMGPQVNGFIQIEKPFTVPGVGHKKGIRQEQLVVESNETFALFATTNTGGKVEGTVEYAGRSPIDQSTRDRFLHYEKDYMPKEQEITVLKAAVPNLRDLTYKILVDVANLMRKAYVEGEAFEPHSTRSLVQWAELIEMTDDIEESFLYSSYYQFNDHDRSILANAYEACFQTLNVPVRQTED